MKHLAVGLIIFLGAVSSVNATCYSWPLGSPSAYDGDTLYITVPELPGPLEKMSVRVLGVDTPELRGKCDEEKILARKARDFVRSWLESARTVRFCNLKWDKYGGRIDADVVVIDGNGNYRTLVSELIVRGLGRAYAGGQRKSWCE